MLPPRESNRSNDKSFSRAIRGQGASTSVQDRITELESRNSYLQSLVVELLDKNERLRHKLAQKEKGL